MLFRATVAVKPSATPPTVFTIVTAGAMISTKASSIALTAASPMEAPENAGVPVTVPVFNTGALTVPTAVSVCVALAASEAMFPTGSRMSSVTVTLINSVLPVLVTA